MSRRPNISKVFGIASRRISLAEPETFWAWKAVEKEIYGFLDGVGEGEVIGKQREVVTKRGSGS